MSTPWAVRVDGLWLPRDLSGHPGLELCNTRAGWDAPPVRSGEYLRGYDELALLAARSGLVSDPDRLRRMAIRDPAAASGEVSRAVAIRADLYAVFTGTASARATTRVANELTVARSHQVLDLSGPVGVWRAAKPIQLTDPLDALLVAAGELLSSPQAARVRACPGRDCGWLFVNASGRRRWCQMAVCGNRAKQAAHVARQAE